MRTLTLTERAWQEARAVGAREGNRPVAPERGAAPQPAKPKGRRAGTAPGQDAPAPAGAA